MVLTSWFEDQFCPELIFLFVFIKNWIGTGLRAPIFSGPRTRTGTILIFLIRKKNPQEPEVLRKSWKPPDNAGSNQQGITKIWEVFKEWVFMKKEDTFSHQTK